MSDTAIVAKSKVMLTEDEKYVNLTKEELAIVKQESIVPSIEHQEVLKSLWLNKSIQEKNKEFNALMWLVMENVYITKPNENEVSKYHWHRNIGLLGEVYALWAFNKDVETLNALYSNFGIQGVMAYFAVKDKETGLDKLDVFYPAPYLATQSFKDALVYLGFNPSDIKKRGYEDSLFCSGYGELTEEQMQQILFLYEKGILFNNSYHEETRLDDNGWHLFMKIGEMDDEQEFIVTIQLADLHKVVQLVEENGFNGALAWSVYKKEVVLENQPVLITEIIEKITERDLSGTWVKVEQEFNM